MSVNIIMNLKKYVKKIGRFTGVDRANMKKLFTKLQNKKMKKGYAYNLKSNRMIKIGGRAYKKLNKKNSSFKILNDKIDVLMQLNNKNLKKVYNRIYGGGLTSYTVFVYRIVGNPRKHATNESNFKGKRIALVATHNGITIRKTTKFFRNSLDKMIRIQSNKMMKYIAPVLMRDGNMAEVMISQSFNYSHYIKIIQNGSISNSSLTNYEVGQVVLRNSKTNMYLNNKYINYELNSEAKTFGELFYKPAKYENDDSCMVDAIMNKYEECFQKSRYKNLTYGLLCKILNIEEKKSGNAISLENAKQFFKKYKLGLIAYDTSYNKVYEYKPEKYSTHIRPRNFRLLVHNNHCYMLNNNIKQLEQKKQEVGYIRYKLAVTSKYKFRVIKELEEYTFEFINNLNDVVSHIKNVGCSTKIRYFYNGDMQDLFLEMVRKHKYEPRIFYQHKRILSLEFKVGNKFCIISHPDYNNMNDMITFDVNKENYETFIKTDDTFYQKIIKSEYISMFNDDAMKINEAYPKSAAIGIMGKPNQKGIGIDVNKCYSWALQTITKIPIFHYFDRFINYDDHSLEDLTMYVVRSCDNSEEGLILLPTEYSRVYGFKLKQMKPDAYEILYFIRPSNIASVEFKSAVDALYATDLENISVNKFIANKITGQLEKKYNHKSVTKIFRNPSEAYHYQKLYGGEIIPIADDVILHQIATKKATRETFRPIKELIYDLVSIKMYNIYNKCYSAGLDIIGIKTDCIIVANKVEEINNHFTFDKKIGGLKLEKDAKCAGYFFGSKWGNELVEPAKHKVNNIAIKDEYDMEEITSHFDTNNRILINATLPGCGKSYSVKHYKGKKILFVAPFNKLCQSIRSDGHDAITYHKLFSLNIHNTECKHMKKYDISPYDVICFDEIYMYSYHQLSKIKMYMDYHKDKQFIATGDLCQLDPIQNEYQFNNIDNMDNRTLEAMGDLFPNQITLRICKRVKTDKERKILESFKQEIFNEGNKPFDVLSKYFKVVTNMKQVRTLNNITFYNFRAKMVGRHIHNQQAKPRTVKFVNGVDYYKGMELVCRKYSKKPKLYVNYTYKIVKIKKREFIMQDICEGDEIVVPIEMITDHFRLSYGSTCHSFQGLSVDGGLTIFDSNTCRINRKWLYTAITRSTDLSKIQIFKHSDKECYKLEESMNIQKLKNKISSYKSQDKRADRTWNDEKYINTEWVTRVLQKHPQCPVCRCGLAVDNLSVDRIDNKLPHLFDNCRITCLDCNLSRNDRELSYPVFARLGPQIQRKVMDVEDKYKENFDYLVECGVL